MAEVKENNNDESSIVVVSNDNLSKKIKVNQKIKIIYSFINYIFTIL